MSTASETQLNTALKQGIANLSRDQFITFTQYTKHVMAQDSYVFWVATANTLKAPGILHYDTERDQDADQTVGVNTVQFTSEVEVTELNAIGTGTMWLADWNTPQGTMQIAFSSRTAYFEQSGLFHYVGVAVYPALQSQIVASVADLPAGPIVSNSLPIWLQAFQDIPASSSAPLIPAYPAFLVPENIVPPYVVIDIDPEKTQPLQALPHRVWPSPIASGFNQITSYQLVKDRVHLIFYGLTNQQVLQILEGLLSYSYGTDNFGLLSLPVVRDEQRTQVEIAALAMKKSLTLDVSYYQTTADVIARRLITSALVAITIQ